VLSNPFSIWFVIIVALLAANWPFVTQRWLLLGPHSANKPLALRLLELLLLYFAVGGMALLLEARAGQIAPQGWEFYAITAALFITLAFPGFVWRYLVRRREKE